MMFFILYFGGAKIHNLFELVIFFITLTIVVLLQWDIAWPVME